MVRVRQERAADALLTTLEGRASMTGQWRVTPEMLQRPVSEVNLGEFAGALGMLLRASGVMGPVSTPAGPHVSFPPSPCDLSMQALWMTTVTDGNDRILWQTIYDAATTLCATSGHSGTGGSGGGGSY
jgi:hypothetical protein